MQRYAPALGRVLLSVIFVVTAFQDLLSFAHTTGMLAARGWPVPSVALALGIVLKIGGALLLLLGARVRLGAVVLILFLLPTLFFFHNFWAYEGADRHAQSIQFMKNLALIGGLLQIVGFGGGPPAGGGRGRRS